MMFKTGTAAIVVLGVAAGLAQSTSPVAIPADNSLVSQRQSVAGRNRMTSLAGNKTAGVQTPATLRERVQDMQVTLTKMHAVLKQMRARAASSSKDPLAKANLDMWELLVGHLDKQFQELQIAMITRDDMETRRAAMYKQVDAKAEAAARAARAAQTPTPVPAGQTTGQRTAGQSVGGQTLVDQSSPTSPTTPPATASPSPN
jgi:hypothetical protein